MTARELNIVLVEDDDIDVMNVRRAFQKSGITSRLWVACDGVECLSLLRSGEVPKHRRLLLLDVNMPRMNGLELMRELRKDPQLAGTRVVVLTTSNDERDLAEASRLNAAGYFLKPATFTAFVELMTALDRYWTLAEMA